MTIRITDKLAVSRIGKLITLTAVDGFDVVSVALTPEQAQGASEALAVLAIMAGYRDDEELEAAA